MSRGIRFRARFRKISTGKEILQFANLRINHICNPIANLPIGYTQATEWEQQYDSRTDADGVDIF